MVRLQEVAADSGLRVSLEEGRALIVDAADGRRIAHFDQRARTLRVGPLALMERTERESPSLYDTVPEHEYPLQPDLLLMQQLLFCGLRWEDRGSGDFMVSSAGRLQWPHGESALMAPALLGNPADAWMWEGLDPAAALGDRVAGMDGAWIVDVPALVGGSLESSKSGEAQVPDAWVAWFATRAAAEGVALRRLPAEDPLWVVAIDGHDRGTAELSLERPARWRSERCRLLLRGADGSRDVVIDVTALHGASEPVLPWQELFHHTPPAPIYRAIGIDELVSAGEASAG